MDILKDLNPEQKRAVETISGPVLVVAGPGSGKTKTLTHRIAHLISTGVLPQNILAVTFTNKAADEMKMRVRALLEPATDSHGLEHGFAQISHPLIGTFHSICARILRREAGAIGYTSGFSIYDEEDALKLVKSIMKDLSIDHKQFSPPKIRSTISSLKDDLVSPEDYEIEAHSTGSGQASDPFRKAAHRVYAEYQDRLKKHNAMDFDDLLMKTVELFEKNPRILAKYQSQFQYVLIDEFQDTNLSQYKIANYLAQSHKNLYCIGDLDQSIYSFRGADYRNIMYFEKDWPDAKIITLGQNYRSVQNILDAADGIISQNTNRKEKKLWSDLGSGDRIVIKEAEDEAGEGEFILEKIVEHVRDDNMRLKDCVVLYRTNAQSRAIEETFLRGGIPYKIIGGIKFYQRKEIKDILAWLRLCLNASDEMARNRVHDLPAKFLNTKHVTDNTKHKTANTEQALGVPLSPFAPLNNSRPTQKTHKINAFILDFSDKAAKLKVTELLKHIIQNAGFEERLRDGTEKGEERWDNVRELLSVSARYDEENPLDAVRMLIEEAALAQETDNMDYEKDLVSIMTLHAVKGLEFPVVFIAGCEQGILPHARALFGATEDDLEEERRLCYVGVTRAKKRVYLIFAQRRMIFGRTQSNPPSEFLRDIPEHLIEFVPGDEERIIDLD